MLNGSLDEWEGRGREVNRRTFGGKNGNFGDFVSRKPFFFSLFCLNVLRVRKVLIFDFVWKVLPFEFSSFPHFSRFLFFFYQLHPFPLFLYLFFVSSSPSSLLIFLSSFPFYISILALSISLSLWCGRTWFNGGRSGGVWERKGKRKRWEGKRGRLNEEKNFAERIGETNF
ncbi:MAG: hypothetical protein ACTS4V_01475 [Candidatus Hodgkinia cicadicola]